MYCATFPYKGSIYFNLDLTDDQFRSLEKAIKDGEVTDSSDMAVWARENGFPEEDLDWDWDDDFGGTGELGCLYEGFDPIIHVSPSSEDQKMYAIKKAYQEDPDSVHPHVSWLWDQLGDVPVNNDGDPALDEDFFIWEKGTLQYDVWAWFDERFMMGLGPFMNREYVYQEVENSFSEEEKEDFRLLMVEFMWANRKNAHLPAMSDQAFQDMLHTLLG